jgi:hypothetical protein
MILRGGSRMSIEIFHFVIYECGGGEVYYLKDKNKQKHISFGSQRLKISSYSVSNNNSVVKRLPCRSTVDLEYHIKFLLKIIERCEEYPDVMLPLLEETLSPTLFSCRRKEIFQYIKSNLRPVRSTEVV